MRTANERSKSRAVYAVVSHLGPRVTVYYAAHDSSQGIAREIDFADLESSVKVSTPILRYDMVENPSLSFLYPSEVWSYSRGREELLAECLSKWREAGIPIEYKRNLSPVVRR